MNRKSLLKALFVLLTIGSLSGCGTPDAVENAANLIKGHLTTYKGQLDDLVKWANGHRAKQATRLSYLNDNATAQNGRTDNIVAAWKIQGDKKAVDMLKALRAVKAPPTDTLAKALSEKFGKSQLSTKNLTATAKAIEKGVKAPSFIDQLKGLEPFVKEIAKIVKDTNTAAKDAQSGADSAAAAGASSQ